MHPRITLQFLTGPEVVNISKREADLAIRLVRPNQQNLQVKRIGSLSLAFYAAKSFIKANKINGSLESLKDLPFVGLSDEAIKPDLYYTLKTHAWSSVYAALSAGIGFRVLPDFITKKDVSLELLNCIEAVTSPIWLVIHPDLKNNARIKALLEELKNLFYSVD